MSRRLFTLLLLVGSAAIALGAQATATARETGHQPAPALDWRYELNAASILATQGYVWLEAETGTAQLLINGTTDASSRFPIPPWCGPAAGSSTELLWNCQSTTDPGEYAGLLYAPATHHWQFGKLLRCGDQGCSPEAVGNDWIEWYAPDCSAGARRCTGYGLSWQNISTGATQPPEMDYGHGRLDDPDLPGLVHRVCSPVVEPEDERGIYGGPIPGDVEFYGRFAVVAASPQQGTEATYLEECGSTLREQLQSPSLLASPSEGYAAGTDSLLAWVASPRVISYVQLPSLARGQWTVPAALGGHVNQVAIAGDRIFIQDGADVYSASLPSTMR